MIPKGLSRFPPVNFYKFRKHGLENGLGPAGEETADKDELADVVGVVVSEQESLAEERLVVGVRDGREEID